MNNQTDKTKIPKPKPSKLVNSYGLTHRVIPGPLVEVTAAAREEMLLTGLGLPEVLRIHTSIAVHALQINRPGTEVVTRIAISGHGGLVITTVTGPIPEKNCTYIWAIHLAPQSGK